MCLNVAELSPFSTQLEISFSSLINLSTPNMEHQRNGLGADNCSSIHRSGFSWHVLDVDPSDEVLAVFGWSRDHCKLIEQCHDQ